MCVCGSEDGGVESEALDEAAHVFITLTTGLLLSSHTLWQELEVLTVNSGVLSETVNSTIPLLN